MGDNGPINPYAPPKAESLGLAEEHDAPRTGGTGGAPVAKQKSAWTTVASFGTVDKAVDALRRLEKAKILCRVLNDGTTDGSIALHWVRSMPLGGHRVQVHPDDLAEAATVLGVSIEPDEFETSENPADERMKKAFLASVLGTFVCPGVAQLISLALVLATPASALSAVGRTRRRWATVVSLLVLGGLFFALITEAPSTPADDLRRKVAPSRALR
jgi:hypothetical protein